MINHIVNSKLGLKLAVSELIDNACDHHAKNVSVLMTRSEVTVEDDGAGVTDLAAMVTYGRHDAERDGRMGRYGIGFKHAAIWLGGKVHVDTRRHGKQQSIDADWSEIQATGNWFFDLSDLLTEAGPSFTRVTVSAIHPHRIRQPKEVAQHLAYLFAPGIINGLRLCVDGEDLVPPSLPDLTDIRTFDESFDGRHFRATIGILSNPQNERRHSYDVAYAHRLIRMTDDEDGPFGDFSNARIYGYLELLSDGEDDWTLSDHKEDFEERPALYEYLYEQCEDLFRKAETEGQTLEFRELEDALSERVASAFDHLHRIREKRNSATNKSGTRVEPANTGRERNNASKTDPTAKGSVITPRIRTFVNIKFDYVRDGLIGEVQKAPAKIIVHLNPKSYFVKQHDTDALAAVVCALLANHQSHAGRKGQMAMDFKLEGEMARFIELFTDYSEKLAIADEAQKEQ